MNYLFDIQWTVHRDIFL